MDLRSDRKFQSHKSADERKMIASFFTYQRLCENSLATWWRNVFLMSSVSLFILNTDDTDIHTIARVILLTSTIVLLWATYSYHVNIDRIIETAPNEYKVIKNWSWILFGIFFVFLHGYISMHKIINA